MITYEVRVYPSGTKCWYLKGQLHREDGPAVEYPNGTKCWYLKGKLHREDGPAVEWANGAKKEWHLNGKLHREDGPAIEYASGEKFWYLNGKEYTELEHKQQLNPAREMTVAEISKALGFDVKIIKE